MGRNLGPEVAPSNLAGLVLGSTGQTRLRDPWGPPGSARNATPALPGFDLVIDKTNPHPYQADVVGAAFEQPRSEDGRRGGAVAAAGGLCRHPARRGPIDMGQAQGRATWGLPVARPPPSALHRGDLEAQAGAGAARAQNLDTRHRTVRIRPPKTKYFTLRNFQQAQSVAPGLEITFEVGRARRSARHVHPKSGLGGEAWVPRVRGAARGSTWCAHTCSTVELLLGPATACACAKPRAQLGAWVHGRLAGCGAPSGCTHLSPHFAAEPAYVGSAQRSVRRPLAATGRTGSALTDKWPRPQLTAEL